tara:strand:- start:2100 stop:2576 length:477 start_codon:yes stop_codon:yes gene_type:complete
MTEKTKSNIKMSKTKDNAKIAIILVRGFIGIKKGIKDTLHMLRLYKKYSCVIVNNNPSTMGMIIKCKDYITYGEIDDQTYKSLVEKRGEQYHGRLEDTRGKIKYNKFIEVDNKKLKPYFRLSPPKGGFERKGTKSPYTMGGVLGYRANKINDLIKKML